MRLVTRMAIGGLSLTASGLISIATWEGFRGEAYVPVPGDVPTIGFGSTEGVRLGDKISVPDALNRLEKDVRVAEDAVRKCVKVPLFTHEFDVYTSLAYNLGGKAFCGSTLVRKLNTGDYAGACEEIKRWTCGPDPTGKYALMYPGHHCGHGKAPLPGLVNRRAEEYRRCIGEVQG